MIFFCNFPRPRDAFISVVGKSIHTQGWNNRGRVEGRIENHERLPRVSAVTPGFGLNVRLELVVHISLMSWDKDSKSQGN